LGKHNLEEAVLAIAYPTVGGPYHYTGTFVSPENPQFPRF
jgi:hypothetical protein